MLYTYAVVSRRSGGVSVGVNLNPNRACNWSCIYCQVPGLTRGQGPPIDLERLERELAQLLATVRDPDWLAAHVPEGLRRLNDVALSGDGEATTSPDFARAVEVIGNVLDQEAGPERIRVILITNGSRVQSEGVQSGLRRLDELGGEIWFKLDAGTREGRRRLGGVAVPDERVLQDLTSASALCRLRLQVMRLAIDGRPPSAAEDRAWIDLVREALSRGARITDVLLYGLERPPQGPQAARLSKAPDLETFAALVEKELSLPVQVHP